MSIHPDIRDQAYQFFVEEAPELLEVLEAGLLTLREERDTAKVHTLMRAAHSLKGSSASVGLDTIKSIAHRLESIFKALYSDTVEIDIDLETLLLQAYDALKLPLVEQISTGTYDQEEAIARADDIFIILEDLLSEALERADDYLPSSSDLGVDMVASIFEVDVEQGIERLQEACQQPDSGVILSEVEAQAEVFEGIAELLNLNGFGAIAKMTRQALSRAPDQALQIAQLCLKDFQQARAQVIAGKRSGEGEPCEALVALATGRAMPPSNPDHPQLMESTELDLSSGLNELGPSDLEESDLGELDDFSDLMGLDELNDLQGLEGIDELNETDAAFDESALSNDDFAAALATAFQSESDEAQAQDVERLEAEDKPAAAHNLGAHDSDASELDFGADLDFDIDDTDVTAVEPTLPDEPALPDEDDLAVNLFGTEADSAMDSPLPDADADVTADGSEGQDENAWLSELFGDPSDTPSNAPLGDARSDGDRRDETPRKESGAIAPQSPVPSSQSKTNTTKAKAKPPTVPNVPPSGAGSADQGKGDRQLKQQPAKPSAAPSSDRKPQTVAEVLKLQKAFNSLPVADEESFPPIPPRKSSASAAGNHAARNNTKPDPNSTPRNQASVPTPPKSSTQPTSPAPSVSAKLGAEAQPPAAPPAKAAEPSASKSSVKSDPKAQAKDHPKSSHSPGAGEPNPEHSAKAVEAPDPDSLSQKSPVSDKKAKAKEHPKSSNPTDMTQPAAALSVRVSLDRLERMDNQVGELAINRNGLSLQQEQLQRAARDLTHRFSRFQSLVEHLRETSDQILIAPTKHHLQQAPKTQMANLSGVSFGSTFDPLEMDQYSVIYSQLQSMLEEVVQIEESVDDVVLFTGQSNRTLQDQRQMLNQLRHELMWARMLPLGEVLNRFPRVLRDLSTKFQKSVGLKLFGTSVLVDRAVLEKLYDPLLHLLRNAFDHGIESPHRRQELGKPAQGTIEIRAYHQGNKTMIEIRDDGAGLNLQHIQRKALEKGLISADVLASATPSQIFELIFEPGFSTAQQVSEISGRGVGLDIVRSRLRSLQGSVMVTSLPGKGTTFTLCLPLTLTIAKLLVCSVGSTAIALPSDSIEEIVVPKDNQVRQSAHQRFLSWREQIVPVHPLSSLLEYNCPVQETSLSRALAAAPMPREWALPLLVLRREQDFVALEINRLVTEQELVIKPFSKAIAPPGYAYGCTILGDGTLLPVIDGYVLIDQVLGNHHVSTQTTQFTPDFSKPIDLIVSDSKSPPESSKKFKTLETPQILVVDDAATLRRTLALTLQRAGYRVIQARDGREAIEQLEQSQSVHLVICDIEMPNMNGFEFLNYRRQHNDLNTIPVAMLTSRSNDKHRQLALHLGANAYFTKPYTEQEFLGSINSILKNPAEDASGMRSPAALAARQ